MSWNTAIFYRIMEGYLITILTTVLMFWCSQAKVYERCELARDLVQKYQFNQCDIGNWICLIEHTSSYNTSAKRGPYPDGSHDYGIFQINSDWCGSSESTNECGVTCDAFITDDLTAAAKCALKIYSVRGYETWTDWIFKCEGKDLNKYVQDCNL
uniref:lysozyme n=1 Tax=Hadrurus spadix TaxID=141984 RepID=A0A1W7RA98_9SCOR